MKVVATHIPDILILEPEVFRDERGFFYESYNQQVFHEATGLDVQFVQDNHSRSIKGVLRGLHYQLPPMAQAKLVRCIAGAVYDVAVDIRKSSPTFGQWVGVVLNAENKRQLWIPEGFAHGFVVLSEVAEINYKTTSFYAPEYDRGIRWNDLCLQIGWPVEKPLLSRKDCNLSDFADTELFD